MGHHQRHRPVYWGATLGLVDPPTSPAVLGDRGRHMLV
jgi:hypothetical protein